MSNTVKYCGHFCLLGIWIFAQSLSFAQSGTASIKGTLLGQDGKPIGGAQVTANVELARNKALPQPIATGPTVATAKTAGDGTFTLDKLPAGMYTLCAQAPSATHLDPCHWSQIPPSVTVTAGQSITGYKFSLVQGAQFQVRLDDPKKLLSAPAGKYGVPHVLMGVTTAAGQFYPVFVSGEDSTGKDHTLVIPANTNLRFTVYSKQVQLTDSNYRPIDAGGVVLPLRIDSQATNTPPLLFHVVAAN